MKKSAYIVLTILLSLATIGYSQSNPPVAVPEPSEQYDTTRTKHYNYYYRSRFLNWCYRTFSPRRYYATVNQQGYTPRRTRSERTPHSRKRGGFGHFGSRPAIS
jgi:hypothetical protein